MTVRELEQRIDARELAEWKAFYRIEPFGYEADYSGHAMTASVVHNLFAKKTRPPADFMPRRKKDPKDIYAMFKIWAMMNGAKRNGKR